MNMRISIVTALLLVACGDDRLDDRRGELGVVVPKPGAFPTGKWSGELTSDHSGEARPVFAGVRRSGEAYEVVLEIGSGRARSFSARQEGAALVVEKVSLHDSGHDGCLSSELEFETLTLRTEGGRLLGDGPIAWVDFEYDTVLDVRHGTAAFAASPVATPPVAWDDPGAVFHSPPGRFGTFVDEAVLLPDEVTIELGSEQFAGLVERGGSWDRNIRVVPTRPLPWGSVASVHVEVLDAAGRAHTLSFDVPTVGAPAGPPDPLVSSLDGYAAEGISELPPADASALLGRETAFAAPFHDVWVLAFEADVPPDGAPYLEMDVVLANSWEGWATPTEPLATVASLSTRPVEIALERTATSERALEADSVFESLEDVTYRVDLSGHAGQRVYISLSSAGTPGVCAPWEGLTVLKRVEILP